MTGLGEARPGDQQLPDELRSWSTANLSEVRSQALHDLITGTTAADHGTSDHGTEAGDQG